LKKRIKELFKKSPPPQPFIPDNYRVYCIGDIHGRHDLLQQLQIKIFHDAKSFNGQIVIVYLGDFIDRGPHSKEVIDFLLANEKSGVEYVYLRGNHEQVLLDCMENPSLILSWLSYGGLAALASYNIAVSKVPARLQDLLDIQQQIKEKITLSHCDFFEKTSCLTH
jgi:serine/threonine protein phosphatase 1